MAGGLWRKARDAAKELCKKDCGRYLVLLIRANVGLVGEMLGKGLVKEAETVVAYLATFAPADTMALLRAEMAAPTGKRQIKALADSDGAGWWVAALRADGISMNGGAVSPADQAAVDLLVTGNDGQAVRLAAELKSVRFACAATPPTSAAMISTRRSRPWARSACGKSTPIPCPPPPTAASKAPWNWPKSAFPTNPSPPPTTHRSGRTARAGKKGVSLALIEPRERPKITKLENDFDLSFSEVH